MQTKREGWSPKKGGVRKRAKYFVMEGYLHYIGGKKKQSPRLVICNNSEQLRLINTVHDQAHLGRDKTLSHCQFQLTEKYYWAYWPSMYEQVGAYVSHVYVCMSI